MHSPSSILVGFTGQKLIFLAAIACLAVACGATGIGSGANPSPTPSDGMGFDVTVTENDHAVLMHAGQKLEVVLHAANGMNDWSHPMSSDTAVLEPAVDPAATAARGVTLAAFVARRQGTAQVTANAGPKCPPYAACPMYLAVYSVTVTVTQ